MGFWIKKLVSGLCYPIPVCILLLATGCGLLWFSNRKKFGKLLVTAGAFLLFLLSLPLLPRAALRALEPDYPPVLNPVRRLEELGSGSDSKGSWTVVLGTGYNPNPDYPFTLQAGPVFWGRMLEGARISRTMPDGRLLVFVSGAGSPARKRRFIHQAAELVGLDSDRIEMIATARSTTDEARLAASVVGQEPFFLVSEALHLRRALGEFRRRDLRPIPAPCGYAAPEGGSYPVLAWFPSSGNIARAQRAVHEALGRTWVWLREAVRGGANQEAKEPTGATEVGRIEGLRQDNE
jgi:uncharacterized SAM-binding protein YcdF (DUF218 family)